jgi:chromosome segregation ATPase
MKERHDTVQELDDRIKNTNLRVSNLEEELLEKASQVEDMKIRNQEELERNHQAECQRAATDKGIIEKMKNKVEALTTLTVSYAQGLYDQCLAQEKMLKLENSLPSRMQHHRARLKRIGERQEDDRHESSLDLILRRLTESVESTKISWDRLLENETDRRQVLVNLNNRVQINQQHYDDMFHKLHKKYQYESDQIKKQFMKTIEMDKEKYTKRIEELMNEVQNQDFSIQNLVRSSNDLNNNLENAKSSNEKLKASCEQKLVYIETLENELSELRTQISGKDQLISDLSKDLSKCQEENSQYKVEIQRHNETLFQLETCLQKTTQRYRERLEQEERRLATNVNVGIQVKPSVCHTQQQIEFVTADTSVVKGNAVANRIFGFPEIG